MNKPPSVIVFDVNGTLSNLRSMNDRFSDVGAPIHLAQLWFESVLRDGFALTAAGTQQPFFGLAVSTLHTVLHGVPLDRPLDDAIKHIMAGFTDLPVHPDVADGIRRLHQSGRRLVTLSNGATAVGGRLLGAARIRGLFEALLSVEDAGAWKPARAAYQYAADMCRVQLSDMLLVAVHPWDIDGAARAGMLTAWINRTDAPYPGCFTPASLVAASLTDLAEALS